MDVPVVDGRSRKLPRATPTPIGKKTRRACHVTLSVTRPAPTTALDATGYRLALNRRRACGGDVIADPAVHDPSGGRRTSPAP